LVKKINPLDPRISFDEPTHRRTYSNSHHDNNNNNAFYTNSNVLLFLIKRWTFLESGIPLVFFSIKLILPGPGFEPVTSRVAGWQCPCILSHLTQVTDVYSIKRY
jgi:hypothetical protein